MISIKKLIERNDAELLVAVLAAYRGLLSAIGESGVQACPPVGSPLRQSLQNLQAAIGPDSTRVQLEQTGQKAEVELRQWGCGAAGYFRQRADEVKELMMILARTAEATGERDQRYTRQFQQFTDRLKSMADLHDLAAIRDSLMQSAKDLKACAEAMAEESQQSVDKLRQDVSLYQARLNDAERLAGVDALTGLENRRRVESAIESRIARNRPFSILLLDLNGFKQINDTYGHLAADEVLKQFGTELKSAFRATDVVGRWGGDEFIAVLDSGDGAEHVSRITRWVFGDYTIHTDNASRRVPVSAAIGLAEWQSGDSVQSLLSRADAAMYRDKRKAQDSTRTN